MPLRSRILAAVLIAGLPAIAAQAQQKCTAKGVLGGKSFSMTSCAVSYYDDQHSVTIWLDEQAISAAEAESFRVSAYAPEKGRLIQLAFCPGGGKPTPDPRAVKSVGMRVEDNRSPLLGRQWVFELPQDPALKVERLSGDLKLGGSLAGRITGKKTSDGLPYSWEIEFELALPAKDASAGLGCGS